MTPPASSDRHGTHENDVQRRFSDLDALGHVNNVRYLDFLDEGLAAWLAFHDVPRDAVSVRAHRLGFAEPMLFSRWSAEVWTGVVSVQDDVVHVAQEVRSRPRPGDDGDGEGDGSTVHLRAESWLRVTDADGLRELGAHVDPARAHAWRDVPGDDGPPRHTAALWTRARDVGGDGLVRADAVVEYFQEARVQYFADLHTTGEQWAMVVLARTDVELLGDVRHGDDVRVQSRISHLGRSSFTIAAGLEVDGALRATSTVVAVCVGDDQRPVPVPAEQRRRLEAELSD